MKKLQLKYNKNGNEILESTYIMEKMLFIKAEIHKNNTLDYWEGNSPIDFQTCSIYEKLNSKEECRNLLEKLVNN